MSNLINYVIKYSTDRSTIRIRTELRDDLFTITLATPTKLTGEDDLGQCVRYALQSYE